MPQSAKPSHHPAIFHCSFAAMRWRVLPAICLMASGASAQGVFVVQSPMSEPASPIDVYRARTAAVRPCDRSGDAIVVCGNRAERNARQRLPLPDERESVTAGGIVRGEAPRASAARVRQGACGVVANENAICTGGWNAAKVLDGVAKGITAIIDPDADLAPPPPLPDRFRAATPR